MKLRTTRLGCLSLLLAINGCSDAETGSDILPGFPGPIDGIGGNAFPGNPSAGGASGIPAGGDGPTDTGGAGAVPPIGTAGAGPVGTGGTGPVGTGGTNPVGGGGTVGTGGAGTGVGGTLGSGGTGTGTGGTPTGEGGSPPIIPNPEPGPLAACRGVVAVTGPQGIYVGWRLKATDPANLAFNVYRGATLLTPSPITNSTNLVDGDGSAGDAYSVRPVLDGAEQGASETVTASGTNYISIPLNGTAQAGRLAGVGDLDGDCRYDYVIKRGNVDIDVTQIDATGETFTLEAYNADGSFMWRRSMGTNIEPGVFHSPFVIYDLDSDGRAEVIAKAGELATAQGGDGDLNGDGLTNYRAAAGNVPIHNFTDNQGVAPEYLEVYAGETGAVLARAPWIPVGPWGSDGNRYNRNLMTVGYLDGQQPSVIMTRGGNDSRNEAHAYDFRNGQLTLRWQWFRGNGQGAYGHNIRAADIDGDGRDELLHFSVAVDDDGGASGATLWDTGQAHGDRFHVTDIDPSRPGLEIFYIQEFADVYVNPIHVRDARTGALVWGLTGNAGDVGRGVAGDFDPDSPGIEVWASTSDYYSATGQNLGGIPFASANPNMSIWWDADLSREHLTRDRIEKWNNNGAFQRLLTATGCAFGTREIPMGYADVLGDWREEPFWVCNNNSELRVYVSTDLANQRLYTLMQDPQYRTNVATLTNGYVQAVHPEFYMGAGMGPQPTPRIAIPAGK